MMTDQASGARTEQTMMAGEVARDPADCRALQTTGGVCGSAGEAGCKQGYCQE
jgi:hypothetical protein